MENYNEFSSFEEKNEEKTEVFAEEGRIQAGGRSYEGIARYLFLALAFLLPLWALPFTASPIELNKAFFVYAIVIIAVFFWAGELLRAGVMRFPKSVIFLALLGIVIVFGISTIFSTAPSVSFIGTGSETTTFLAILFLSIAAFLASIFFSIGVYVLRFYLALFISSLVLFVLQIFQTGFGVTILPFAFLQGKAANLVGSWNELGIFFGFIALSSVLLLEAAGGRLVKNLFLAVALASFIAVAFVNFTLVWWVLAPFFVVFFTYKFITGGRARIFSFATFALIVSVFFIFGGAFMAEINTALGINVVDVRPTVGATWTIIKGAIGQNAFLGTGPNTFLYDWLKWKPVGVNNTVFWSSRFQSGFGTLISIAATAGILGGLAFIVFLALFFWRGIRSVLALMTESKSHPYLLASFFGALYLWIFAIIYSPGFLLFSLTFLVAGVFIGIMANAGIAGEVKVSLFQNKGAAFVWTLLMVFLIIMGTGGLYLLSQKYIAAYSFGEGIKAFNARGDIDSAERVFSRAARFDGQDRYFRSLAEVGLVRLNQLLSRRDLSQADLQAQFQAILSATIQNARSATDGNPIDPLNWMMQGKIFEAVMPFKIAGAPDAAKTAYTKASELSPQDPEAYLALARVEIQNGNLQAAKETLLKSVAVKNDYAPGHFLLAQVEAQGGNITEAIFRTETAVLLVPNDVGAWFQLGLLQYQQNNLDRAQAAFERAVSLSANYSNARYFLGLIYDKQGRKDNAISQFEKIAELNPGNEEVKTILSNLKAGRSALAGISPPAPTPEKRTAPPVKEKASSGSLGE